MKLKDTNLSVCLWSEDYEKLAKWYEEVLGFRVKRKLTLPDDTGVDFDFGSNYFYVGKHDKVKGENKDKYRLMSGFNVESVTKVYEEIKTKNVKVIAPPFEGPPGGFWCMTIEDPDGNLLQFFGDK